MSAPAQRSRPPSPARILVADGDADTRALYRHSLRNTDCDVVDATDGRDALVKALSQRPALVIADTHLPALDGYALCEILRQDFMTRTSILVMTGDAESGVVERARRAGADAVLVKPISPELLRSEIDRLLERPPAESKPTRTRGESSGVERAIPDRRVAQRVVCPLCGRLMKRSGSHMDGVRMGPPDLWDDYRCLKGCGSWAHHQPTRSLRHVT